MFSSRTRSASSLFTSGLASAQQLSSSGTIVAVELVELLLFVELPVVLIWSKRSVNAVASAIFSLGCSSSAAEAKIISQSTSFVI